MNLIDFQSRRLLKVFDDRFDIPSREILSWAGTGSFIDRTGVIDYGVKLKNLTPLPKSLSSYSFDECMDRRAVSLLQIDYFDFYWSGGIDSTAALIALLRNGLHPEQISVCYSELSVFEYPEFFKSHIDGKLPTRAIVPSVFRSLKPDVPFITGELGDQMFGSTKIRSFTTDVAVAKKTPWKDYAALYFSEITIALWEKQLSFCPWPIANAYEFLWWLNFTGKWQNVHLRMGDRVSDFLQFLKNAKHFYNSEDFQSWAMAPENRHAKCENTWESHKMVAKNYIHEYTKDAIYRNSKKKIGSLPANLCKPFLMQFEDGERVVFGEESDLKATYHATFGDRHLSIFKGEHHGV